MSSIYEYVRHPRIAELHLRPPIRAAQIRGVDHQNWFVRFNARFGLWITLIVGTMWCAYLFTVLALYRTARRDQAGDRSSSSYGYRADFLQLVLLPIIIVGQNIQAKAADKRAEETYKDAEAVLKESEEIQKHLLAQDQAISNILERLHGLSPDGQAKPQ